MGSDAGISPHGRNAEELAHLVECGLSPVEAVRCATGSAARLLEIDEQTGTLEPGKRADVLVLEGSPLDLTGIAARVAAVYMDGELAVRPEPSPVPAMQP
jgi:imidazolonepropionase-like amidohydrolase